MENYSIKIQKEYLNFAASHFLIFKDGTREPLHGHNYRVRFTGHSPKLEADMVFDFLDIKPVIRKICDSLDHKLLLPQHNEKLVIETRENNYTLITPDESVFSIPKQDVLILPIENTSAERLAIYLSGRIKEETYKQFQFKFSKIEVEVEETPGQSAHYVLQD